MSGPPESVLVLTSAVRAVKSAAGPVAWAVLEELLLEAAPAEDGRLVATASVRRLGAALGLDKDTVARGLERLRAAGFVARCPGANPGGRSCYVIASLAGVSRAGPGREFTDPVRDPARPRSGDRQQRPSSGDSGRSNRRRAPRAGSVRPPSGDQLSLLCDNPAHQDGTVDAASPKNGRRGPPTKATQHTTSTDHPDADTEPDDDHRHRHPRSPIRTPDTCQCVQLRWTHGRKGDPSV